VFSTWVYDLARNIDRRVTQGRTAVSAVWTRDSRSILHGGTGSLVRVDLEATGTPAVIRDLGGFANTHDVSADGRDVLLMLLDDAGDSRMAVMPLDGSAAPHVLGEPDRASPYAAFSPDGQWIAFVGREGNARRLFVQRKSGQGARIPVTAATATYPRWRGDGRELYYLSRGAGDPDMMMMPVAWTTNGPDFGTPQKLFTIVRYVGGNLGFDVTPDGQKFALIVGDPPADVPFTVRVTR
jgi:Tol biopolymer transport system component